MLKRITSFLIAFIIIGLGGLYFWWQLVKLPVNSKNQTSEIFVIPQGWGSNQIAQALKKEGLIKSELGFKLLIFKNGIDNKLQAGDFRLSPSMSLSAISQALTHGTLDIWVVIPEGLRKEEIAQRISSAFTKQDATFDIQEFLSESQALEGYLFPDTYLIPKNSSPSAVITMLTNNFKNKYASLSLKTPRSKKEIVILASILEREAKKEEDRQMVAGILSKRLKQDWPLQVDASIQYALANITCDPATMYQNGTWQACDWWPEATHKDLTIDSPYNTYENLGLPPTPICNPGLASLKSAANPKDSPYYYYLSDPSGNLHWAETNSQQEENIDKFLIFPLADND